jgi:hypothetical protein
VFNVLLHAAFGEVTVLVKNWDVATALVWIIGALSTIVSAKTSFRIFHSG